jgi:uncharacterized protein
MRSTTHASPQLPPRETGLRSFVRSRPVLAYFALTGTISWGGALLLIPVLFGRMPVPAEEADRLFIYPLLITVAGPPLAALLLTGLVDGRNGLRDLRSRLGAWRVGARWYALASLAAPLAVIAVLLPLSLLSPDFLPAIATTDARSACCWSDSRQGWQPASPRRWAGRATPSRDSAPGTVS